MKDRLKNILQGFYKQDKLFVRLPIMLFSVIMMGFCLSWLILVNWGTDPCSAMNLAISARLGISFGTWQASLNIALFIIVILCGGNDIGYGTFANMFLVGYSSDFFSWVWSKVLPAGFLDPMGIKIAVFVVAIIVFVFVAAIYMDSGLGMAPYDAIPFIIKDKVLKKVPFKVIRTALDFTAILISVVLGRKVGIATICMALLLGTVIEFVGHKMKKILG